MTDVRPKDRKAALKRHGEDCLKCGSDIRVEVHHVYGTADRDPDHHRPLCYRCHLIAPMGDAYWEQNGEDGWTGFDQIFKPVIDVLTPEQCETITANLPPRKPKRKQKVLPPPDYDAIASFTMELRYKGMSFEQIASYFNDLGVGGGKIVWDANQVEADLNRFYDANCVRDDS